MLRKYCDYQSETPPPSTDAYSGPDPAMSAQVDAMLKGGSYCALAGYYERADVVPRMSGSTQVVSKGSSARGLGRAVEFRQNA